MFYMGFFNCLYFPDIFIGWTNDISLYKKGIINLYKVIESDTIFLILVNDVLKEIIIINKGEPPPLMFPDENAEIWTPEDFKMEFFKLPTYEKYLLKKIDFLETENRILRSKNN